MLKHKKISIVKNPVQIGHSVYVPIPRKECILNKDKVYVFNIEISEVDL